MTQKEENTKNSLGSSIKKFMALADIRPSELSRHTAIPQATLNKLLAGTIESPRLSTISPIARYFSLTIEQLMGEQPIPKGWIPGSHVPSNRKAWTILPIIDWDLAKHWSFEKDNITPRNYSEWISTERDVSNHAFALHTKPFMEPRFHRNSIILVDPDVKYSDGDHVLVSKSNQTPTVRKIISDGKEIFLEPIILSLPTEILSEDYQVIGTIIECRIHF